MRLRPAGKLGLIVISVIIIALATALAYSLPGLLAQNTYNSLTPVSYVTIVANFSDDVPSPLMYEMINNTYHSALRNFVTLTPPPYPVVNVTVIPNTLVTFKLPNGELASVVVHGGELEVYIISGHGYELFTIVEKPVKVLRIETIYPREGILTPVGVAYVADYRVPLPGGVSIDVYFGAYSAVWYIGNQVTANTTAAGWFYVEPGVEVSNVIARGSARAGFGFAYCTGNPPGAVQGVGTFAAQTYIRASYALYSCPVTLMLVSWPWVGVDANGNFYFPTSFPGTTSFQAVCGCLGTSQ
ncbi:hypothetical protein [Vulcanisaeta thermophila]|uniref:hypothetical protein n=1 Tax=Vulcanisaeta thermophila TaxID=867917 RepID=UPI00085329AA|nr:hypothetical protein [Vulcanisaeta thermophila]